MIVYLLCRSALTPGGRRKAWRRWPQTSRSIWRILWISFILYIIMIKISLLLLSSSSSYLELRSDLRRKLAVLELPLWLPGRLLLPCLHMTLVSKDPWNQWRSLWTSVPNSGERPHLNTVTFAELYCLPMTMLCAVEGVTRAGVVDAAGVAGKSASEMGHSR